MSQYFMDEAMGVNHAEQLESSNKLQAAGQGLADDQYLMSRRNSYADEGGDSSDKGTSFYTARDSGGDHVDTGAPADDSNYRTNANADAFDINAFRRQMGFAPPPRPAPAPPKAPLFGSRRMASVDSDDSIFSDESDSDGASSRDSISTRAMSNANPGLFKDPIAHLNAGRQPARKRGFFSKLWSLVRGKGWR